MPSTGVNKEGHPPLATVARQRTHVGSYFCILLLDEGKLGAGVDTTALCNPRKCQHIVAFLCFIGQNQDVMSLQLRCMD